MIKLSRDSIVYKKLLPLSKALHKADEDYCNSGFEERHTAIVKSAMRVADRYLSPLGLKAFHQSDCRGTALYIIDDTMNDSNYTNGIAVYE